MKKLIFILIFLLPILLLSCSSNNEAELKLQLEIAERQNQELKLEKELELVKEKNLTLLYEKEAKAKAKAEADALIEAAVILLKEEAEAKQEAEAKAAVEKKAKEEAEAKVVVEKKAKEEAEAKAAIEKKAKEEAEAKAAIEKKAKEEAEAKVVVEKKAKEEAEAKVVVEKKAKEAAEAKAAAEKKAKEEAQKKFESAKSNPVLSSWETITQNNQSKIASIYKNTNVIGSGFIYKLDNENNAAWVLTNHHVIDDITNLKIGISNTIYDGIVVDSDSNLDIAIIRICCSASDKTFQKLEISNEVANLGKEIGVYGFPTGSEFLNLTTGVISAKKYINGYLHIQTDATINPGNSGGPVLDKTQKVIGISVLKTRSSERVTSVGLLISSDEVNKYIDSLSSSVFDKRINAPKTVQKSNISPNSYINKNISGSINLINTTVSEIITSSPNSTIEVSFDGYPVLYSGENFKWTHVVHFKGKFINNVWQRYVVQFSSEGYVQWGHIIKGQTASPKETKYLGKSSYNINGKNTFKIMTYDDQGFFLLNDQLVFIMDLDIVDSSLEGDSVWLETGCTYKTSSDCQSNKEQIKTSKYNFKTTSNSLINNSTCISKQTLTSNLISECESNSDDYNQFWYMTTTIELPYEWWSKLSNSFEWITGLWFIRSKYPTQSNPDIKINFYGVMNSSSAVRQKQYYDGQYYNFGDIQYNYFDLIPQKQKYHALYIKGSPYNKLLVFLENKTQLDSNNYFKVLSMYIGSSYGTINSWAPAVQLGFDDEVDRISKSFVTGFKVYIDD